MYLRVKNLTEHTVVLDADTGIILDSEIRVFNLTTVAFEDIAPDLLEFEANNVIEYETLFLDDPRNDFPNREYVDGLITGSSSGLYIFRPLDPSPGGSVYTDWSDMLAQLAIGGGGTILIDASLSGGTITLEAGLYDLSAAPILGVGDTRPTVTLPVGFFLSSPTLFAENVDFVLTSGADLLEVASGEEGFTSLRNSSVTSTGAGYFLSVASGATRARVFLENSSFLSSTGRIIAPVAGELVEITALQSTIENDVFAGAGDIDVILDSGSPVDSIQAAHTGTLTLVLKESASRVSFDDTLSLPALGDHTPPDRDTLQLAVDWFKEDRYKDTVFTRDSKDIVTSCQRATDPVVTITRDSKGRAIQLSDGVIQTDINRDARGVVLSVTYVVL